MTIHLVTRAPLRATRKQVQALRGVLPELARVDIDLLELGLDMVPVCVLAWRPADQAEAIVRELADLGLAVEALDLHGLHRAQLGAPADAAALVEASFAPTFHPPALIRVTTSLARPGVDVQVTTAAEPPDSIPITAQIRDGLDLDHFRAVEVVRGRGSLDASAGAPLLDALARVRADRDPEPAQGEGRDGMDVELRVLDRERGGSLVLERWSPSADEAPRLHACLLALLDACARASLPPALARCVADLRRYL